MNFIEPGELAYLLYNRFLQIHLIDLQDDLQKQTIIGAHVLNELSTELKYAPNKGSGIFSICTNEGLRNLISNLDCPFVVLIDESGTGNAVKFQELFVEVEQMTEKARWKGIKWFKVLRHGFAGFKQKFPKMCTTERVPYKMFQPWKKQVSLSELEQYDPPSMIVPNLYLGGIRGTDINTYREMRFKHVLSIGELPLLVSELNLSIHYSPLISPATKSRSEIGSRSVIDFRRFPAPVVLSDVTSRPPPTTETDQGELSIEVDIASNSEASNVYHYMFTLEDISHAPINFIFKNISGIIRDALNDRESVFVHCHGGVSRSSTVILAYLMTSGMSLAQAFAVCFKARPCVRPNDGFWDRLEEYEATTRPAVSMPEDIKQYEDSSLISETKNTSTLPLKQMKLVRLERVEKWFELRESVDL